MVVIRLTRGGAKKRPFYHVVATDKRSRRDGRFIERIGFYNPVAAANENGLVLSMNRIGHWQQHGAQLSPTVARLIRQYQTNQATVPTPAAIASPAAASSADVASPAAPSSDVASPAAPSADVASPAAPSSAATAA